MEYNLPAARCRSLTQGHHPASGDMAHLSPLGWEHINRTGDYHWDTRPTLGPDEFRPLRTHALDFAAAA
jgi:hypothetical protein